MLARLVLLIIALPALALAADAGGGKIRPARPQAQQATVQRAATSPTRLSLTTPSLPADPSECRMSCAQTYYFCRAGDHPEDCSGGWGQCVAGCNSPNLAPGYSSEP